MKETLDFNKGNGLLPVIIQDIATKDVLMLGFMNQEAFDKTIKTGKVYFWSRSRKKLWMKGEESGNILHVHMILKDCDGDTMLILAKNLGKNTCHTGKKSCFFTEVPSI